MGRVELVHWNPRQPLAEGRLLRRLRFGPRVNNFGDLLGPAIVRRILELRGLSARTTRSGRLLSVGSVLRLARDGDTLWGTGANGKTLGQGFAFSALDVRAVRGPLTREVLRGLGIDVPEVYGDPGLLVGHLWNRDELAAGHPHRPYVHVPNFHDFHAQQNRTNIVDPCGPLWSVIGQIAAADFVAGSSLHAVVIADSLGIPARLIRSSVEPLFKYEDYYRGSGRDTFTAAATLDEARERGGEHPVSWSASRLLEAFPADLWSS